MIAEKKVLVTGGNGFIGNAIMARLKNGFSYDLPNDILDRNKIDLAVKSADFVIHCAALADVNQVKGHLKDFFDVNVCGTFEVSQACAKHNKPLAYISTCCVYGDHQGVQVDETSLPLPVEFYAKTKLCGEYSVNELPRYIILRIGTVLGAGMRPALFNFKILNRMHKDNSFEIYGDGSASRNYIYIDDLVDGILLACDKFDAGEINKEILNVCGDEVTTLDDVVMVATEVTKLTPKYEKTEPRDSGDYKEIVSNKKLKSLGWKPKTKYLDAMMHTYEWLKTL